MYIRLTRLLVFVSSMAAALFVHADTAVRHVAMTGSDDNDGLSVDTAFKTVAVAVKSLGSEGGDVYVYAGTYNETNKEEGVVNGNSCFVIQAPIRIIGMTGKPEDVTIKRDSANTQTRICLLDHADAVLKDVTISGGNFSKGSSNGGGNIYITSNGGTVDHCIVKDGYANQQYDGGGNIYMYAGLVSRCIISGGRLVNNDYNRKSGAGVYMAGGVLENSLIVDNTVKDGASVRINGAGKMINCTVANNVGTQISGVRTTSNSQVVNCLIYGNTSTADTTGHQHVWEGDASVFDHCLGEVKINDNCFAGTAGFNDGEYTFSAGSDAIDKGMDYSLTGASATLDLAGNPRVSGKGVDIGCYEYQQGTGLDISFSIKGDQTAVAVPCDLELTAGILNAGDSYTCKWDFDSDGEWDEVVENSPECIWHCNQTGVLSITLRVESDGDYAQATRENLVYAYPRDLYVDAANAASAQAPYMTMATAAPSILAALEFADTGSTIHVADGLYPTNTPIVLSKAIRLESISGDPSKCIISNTTAMAYNQANRRNIQISNSGVVVSGFTFANGSCNQKQGAAINMSAGLVTNCVIVGANNLEYNGDAAVFLSGGTITHCVIRDCLAPSKTSYGYAVALKLNGNNAKADNCLVFNCGEQTGNSEKESQNIVYVADTCQARNLTVVNCKVPTGKYGITASSNARVYNCVAANIVSVNGDVTTFQPWGGTANRFYYCAFDTECVGGTSCVTGTAAEFFKDVGRGKFEPKAEGPLCNAGNDDYVNSPIDLAGKPRIHGRAVDIGCYESLGAGFIMFVR